MHRWLGGLLLILLLLSSSVGSSEIKKFSNTTKTPEFVPGELLVKVKPTETAVALSIFGTVGAKAVKAYGLIPGLYHIKVPPGTERKVLEQLSQRSDQIIYAEPNYIYRITLTHRGSPTSGENPSLPTDEFFNELWGLHNVGQKDHVGRDGIPDADIDALEAWAQGYTGSHDVLVAVIDTGIDYTHPDLVSNIWTNPGETGTYTDPNTGVEKDRATDKIDNDENGYIDDVHGWDFVNDDNDPMDDHNHGTHVSGTIGASGNNNIGVIGVSPNVRLMAVKFRSGGGSGTLADAVSGLEYATLMGAKISNNSWGGGGFSQALFDAIS